jgi:hypothetical protein
MWDTSMSESNFNESTAVKHKLYLNQSLLRKYMAPTYAEESHQCTVF